MKENDIDSIPVCLKSNRRLTQKRVKIIFDRLIHVKKIHALLRYKPLKQAVVFPWSSQNIVLVSFGKLILVIVAERPYVAF